jgi:acetoin utilization protein AcuC
MEEKFAFLFRKEINEYDFGEGHPFHGRRGEDFLKFFKEKIKIDFPVLKAEKATDEDLLLICGKEYIEFTKKYFEAKNRGEEFDGRFFFYHSADNLPIGKPGKIEEAARYIIGQAKLAADLVFAPPPNFGGGFKKVISIGGGLHHAKRNFGEGFCIYNDVAFCAKYLIEKYNLKKILILDTDAHAGNGTLEYFYDDPKILFIDIHQDPRTLYPGTGFVEQKGVGEGEGLKINIPLPPFSGDESYRMVFEEIIEPVVKEFKPQIIIRNGGSDPHFSDPLTNLNLTIEGFKMIGEKVRKLAEICDGKEIDLIASGYNLKVLNYCWFALISKLLNLRIEIQEPTPFPKSREPIEEVNELIKKIKKEFKKYWKRLKV